MEDDPLARPVEPVTSLQGELDHQRNVARYVWDGLRWSMFCGNKTWDEIEAMYSEFFPDIPHPEPR